MAEPRATIKVRTAGPYKVTGAFRIVTSDGEVLVDTDDGDVVLCRCGQSNNKPFCDRSHKECGFEG